MTESISEKKGKKILRLYLRMDHAVTEYNKFIEDLRKMDIRFVTNCNKLVVCLMESGDSYTFKTYDQKEILSGLKVHDIFIDDIPLGFFNSLIIND